MPDPTSTHDQLTQELIRLRNRVAELEPLETRYHQIMETALGQVQDELERRVAERTAELTEINTQLQAEIAERRQTEQALRESEARYRAIVESQQVQIEYQVNLLRNVSDAIITTDPTFKITGWNKAAESIYGYTAGEAIGKRMRDITKIIYLHPAQQSPADQLFQEGFWRDEVIQYHKSGYPIYIHASISVLRDEQGQIIGTVAVNRDITTQKEAKEALRRSEKRYRSLFVNSPISLWDEDYSAVKAYLDQLKNQGVTNFRAYLEQHPEVVRHCASLVKLVDVNQMTFKLYEAKDKTDLTGNLDYLLGERGLAPFSRILAALAEGQTEFETETVERTLTGQPIHLFLKLSLVPGYESTWSRVLVSIVDITKRKQMEEAINQLQQRYRHLFEHAPAMYVVTQDQQGTPVIIDANERFLNNLGYTWAEVQGQPLGNFYTSSSQIRMVESKEHQRAMTSQFVAEERELITREGRTVQTVLQSTPEFDPAGRIVGTRAMYIDVTESKRLQERLAAIYQLGRELTLLRDIATIAAHTLKAIGLVLHCEHTICGLIDHTTGEITYYQSLPGALPNSLITGPAAGAEEKQWPGEAILRTGSALNIPELGQEPDYISFEKSWASRSALGAPLKVGEQMVGVLWAESAEPGHFSLDDQRIMQILADQTAVAVENAHLHNQMQDHMQELTTLNKAFQAMTASLDLNAVLQQILTEVKFLLKTEGAWVLLRDQKTEELIFAAVDSPQAGNILGSRLPPGAGIAGRVMAEKHPLLVEEVQHHPDFYQVIDQTTGLTTQSLLAVPLVTNDRVIGVVETINKARGTFTQHDQELLKALSSSAVIAIENARLFAETEQRAKQLFVLHELDQAITACHHIEDIYEAFAHHSIRLLRYDYMSIVLVEGDRLKVVYLIDEHGYAVTLNTLLPRRGSAIEWVFKTGNPLLRRDLAAEIRFTGDEKLVDQHIRSMLVLPLRIKGEVIGAWSMASQRPLAYTLDDLQIAQSMADQLTITIENARLYENLRQQMKILKETQRQLIQSEKMAALGRLSASVAHEINNPLQVIQSGLTLFKNHLQDIQAEDKLANYLEVIQQEIGRISNITHHMRSFYAATDRHLPATTSQSDPIGDFYQLQLDKWQYVDLRGILEDKLRLVHKQLEQNNINVEYKEDDPLPAIQGNPDHLQQVFLNLLKNAIEAMSCQGGILYLNLTRDQLKPIAGQPVPAVRIEISDAGPGIPAETLVHLFEPFFSTKKRGSGLGLFISYKIIEAHHGQIRVESQVGLGTTFTILLPVEQSQKTRTFPLL